MKINPDDTVSIDLAALSKDLDAQKHVQNEAVARRTMLRIQAETLIDIAVSLRVLAEDAALAMGGEARNTEPEPEDDEPEDAERDWLETGDLVHAHGSDVIAEVLSFGHDQGEEYALVEYQGVRSKEWVKNLVRLHGDERPGTDPLAEIEPPLRGDLAGPVPTAELVNGEPPVREPEAVAAGIAEDLDDEFEGDDFTATESALEALRKLEKPKAKKAAPKKGAKK